MTNVKSLKKLLADRSERAERRQFLVEGSNAVEAALAADAVVELFSTDLDAWPDATKLTRVQLEQITDARSPQPVVALCDFIDVDWSDVVDPRLVVICADIRDPGNAGNVIRTADAAGADAVVFAGEAVDLYNPKTVRGSAGSLFHVPVVIERDIAAAVSQVKESGLSVLATAADGDVELFDIDHEAPTAWLFGNEARGLPESVASLADKSVAIPIYGKAESLNLATAAALCMYESRRVRTRVRP